MQQYRDLVRDIIANGNYNPSRSGDTLSLFGTRMEFDLREGFPLVQCKYTNFDAVVAELLWFLRGETNINTLDSKIWNGWAEAEGSIGPMYGKQWRSWGKEGIDQINILVNQLRNTPKSRRLLVSAWNVADLPDESKSPQQNVADGKMALAPCHAFFQCYVANGAIDLQVYQRSADVSLGVPFNIASYALLVHLLAAATGYSVGRLIWIGGDTHIYVNHVDKMREVVRHRSPPAVPFLNIFARGDMAYTASDITLANYHHGPKVKLPVSV